MTASTLRHGQRIEAAVREILAAIGEDPERDGLRDTPARVARAYEEMFAGLGSEAGGGPQRRLRAGSRRDDPRQGHRVVLDVRAPPCALPRRRPRGLHPGRRRPHHGAVEDRAARRRVRQAARRSRSASPLRSPTPSSSTLAPAGVIVVVEAEHLCMSMRGVRKPGSRTVTSAVRGLMRDGATRAEAMSLIVGK